MLASLVTWPWSVDNGKCQQAWAADRLGVPLRRLRRLIYSEPETRVSEDDLTDMLRRSLPALRERHLQGRLELMRLEGVIATVERIQAGDEAGLAELKEMLSAPAPEAVLAAPLLPGGEG